MQKAEGRRQKEHRRALCASRFLVFLFSAFCLLPSAFLHAQVKGEIESVGFENIYRPDCWTPMVIKITSQTEKSSDYLIRIHQEDLDRDLPIYTRQITVTGAGESANSREQRFRIYFKPTPTDGGLPDASDIGSQNLARLQKALNVELCTTGGKFICTLPVTNTVQSLDPPNSGRGTRLVLVVGGGRSAASHGEYDERTLGLMENIAMVPLSVRDLPESVLGYDAVDAVLWLDADPMELSNGGDEKLRALQSFVKRGGNMVVCQQSDQWQKTLQFGEMLPVTVTGVRTKGDNETLVSMVRSPDGVSPWNKLGPATLGVGVLRPNAIVDSWIDWTGKGDDLSPYIARRVFGCGGVTWVAQDLGDPSLTRIATTQWPVVWNKVFGWADKPLVVNSEVPQWKRDLWRDPRGAGDLGKSLIGGMDLGSTSLWLITVAVVFFIAYWLVAGPGSFIFLAARSKATSSWFVFTAAALVFTLLTVALVKLVLRGPPELKHMSLVRDTHGQPTNVYSRFGLYIKRDGEQTLQITDTAPGTVADLTAFAIHPKHLGEGAPNDIGPTYQVQTSDAASEDGATVRMPYRSTLKKLEAEWSGDHQAIGMTGGIEGTPKLADVSKFIEGKLTNGTGRKLKDVMIAFRWQPEMGKYDSQQGDWVLYIPEWNAGTTLDLEKEYNTWTDDKGKVHKPVPRLGFQVPEFNGAEARPQHGYKVRARLEESKGWGETWQDAITGGITGDEAVDFQHSLWMLSFFDRLVPTEKDVAQNKGRIELLRRSARRFDVSAALGAGAMVIVAQSDPDAPNPLPMPLNVEGDRVTGNGETLYQFVVPMDNTFATTPATQPSTQPNGT